MRFESFKICLSGLVFLFPVFIYAGGEDSSLIPFEIEDQFKNVHTNKSFEEDILIFVTGDRKGSDYSNKWGDTIKTYFKEQIEYPSFKEIPVASLEGMPRLMRGIVRKMMRNAVDNNKNAIMLMDYDNVFHKEYELTDDAANILIFDKERRLIFRKAVYEQTDESVSELTSQFNRLFPGNN